MMIVPDLGIIDFTSAQVLGGGLVLAFVIALVLFFVLDYLVDL